MKSERFSQQTEIESAEQKLQTPETAVEAEISSEELEQFAASSERFAMDQASQILPEAEQKINLSASSMNVGPETLSATRQETGLDAELSEIKSEADALAKEARDDIRAIAEQMPRKAEQGAESPESGNLTAGEELYLEKFIAVKGEKATEGLKGRYEARETGAKYVLNQIREFSQQNGAEFQTMPEGMKELPYNPETKRVILEIVERQIDALLYSQDKSKGVFRHLKILP